MPQTILSLREKKYATQKLKILDTFDEKLKTKVLADISVKEICKELEISEMTFFNYFGSKKEVLVYYIELWSLEMQELIKDAKPIEAIYLIFEQTAKTIEKNPNLFMEIVASMALQGMAKKEISIGKAERILRFGKDVPYEVGGFPDIVMPLIEKLSISKEERFFVYTSLFNTLFATPLLMKCDNFKELNSHYTEQLDAILKGLK